jgi:hypothetical protein
MIDNDQVHVRKDSLHIALELRGKIGKHVVQEVGPLPTFSAAQA